MAATQPADRPKSMPASEPIPLVSVVIPTYNREAVLRRTLASLAAQSLQASQFEVWLVDDGSTDGTAGLSSEHQPFAVHYLRQDRQGPTRARNFGAENSRGAVLIFLDDDICPAPSTIETLARHCQAEERAIVLGRLTTPAQSQNSVYSRLVAAESASARSQSVDLPFTACLTGLLAVRRADFFELGGFQDPTGGWPNWDDVDFGYRAQQAGYRLRQDGLAAGEHWDYAAADLATACQRWERASQSAPRLMTKYPAMRPALPMFLDKGPIDWRRDSFGLALRKLARQMASTQAVVWLLEMTAGLFERYWPAGPALRPLYRWITGAYIFRGYRRGLEELQCSTP